MKVYNEIIDVVSNKIKKNYTFCLLADLHNTKGTSYKLWNKIIKKIESQKPDYILIAGDLIHSADDLLIEKNRNKLEHLFTSLNKISPTYISLGNHDLKKGIKASVKNTLKYYKKLEKITGVHFLDNKTVDLGELNITGFSPRFESYYEKYKEYWIKYFVKDLLKCTFNYEEDKYNIFLTHSPLIISKEETLTLTSAILGNIDLILCGHMHDGFVPRFVQKLKIIKNDKGIVTYGNSTKDFTIGFSNKCRGVHEILNAKMIVSRGVRKLTHNNFFINQFDKACAKDITTIHLIKGENI